MATETMEVKNLRALLAEKTTEAKNISDGFRDETGEGQFVISKKQQADYVNAVSEAKQIKDTLAAMETANGLFEYLDAPAGTPASGIDAAALHSPQIKTLAQAFLTSDAYQEAKSSGFRSMPGSFGMEAGLPALARAAGMQQKDIYSAMGGTVPNIPTLGSAQDLGWTERTLRPGRVRDLFPSETTQAAILYGMRETGYTNRAGVVPERTSASGGPATGGATDVYGLKPKSELSIVPVTYPIATIAHIMYVHKNTLDDEPRMRGLIDRDMIDGLKMTEDQQLLLGDGVGDNLTGLLNTEGIQTYTGLNTDKKSAQIRRAVTRAILAYFQPTGVVMHPFDWENIELETDLNGAYTVAISVAVGGEKRVWRLSVADTPAMPQGRALVGAFGTGAKVYDRQSVTIDVSTENRDMFERNAVTVRCEERLGLVVDRPESFVDLTFTAPAGPETP